MAKKQFETKIVQKSSNLFTKKVIEKGDYEWSPEDGKKREKILEMVGAEYKQINYLAEVLYEIIKQDKNLQNNEVIKNAMEKFELINKIRKGEV